jgi:RNA polymerase sigma-70 factor (ECF subfamily)
LKDYRKIKDSDLVYLICDRGNRTEPAFKEIYKRYAGQVNAYCQKVMDSEDEAEDIFQETFVKFYESIKVTDNLNVVGYLITIARNLCLNRKRIVKRNIVLEPNTEFGETVSQGYDKKELLDLIDSSLADLGEDMKEAFILREYNGFSYTEVAEITGSSLANAKSRVHRAKKRIRELLKPYVADIKRN